MRNPRATLPVPSGIPLAETDTTRPFEFLRVVSKTELQECFGWTEDQKVTNFDRMSWYPRIAVSGDTIHMVWKQDLEGPHEEVCYIRSTDGGITWGDSLVLSPIDGVESICPDVAVEGNNVYVVWEDLSSMSWGGIYFRKSTDGGTTWQSIIPIALRGVDDYDYYRPTMVAKDSSVFVAFAKNVDSDGMLKFKKSTDRGQTWSQEIHISDRAVEGHWAKLVLNSTGLYVTYGNGLRIWCNRSTNWGGTWSNDVYISNIDSSIAQWPSIGADDNGGIYITWFDYKYSPYAWTGDIFLRRSTDNGQTWDSITMLTDNHLCIESDVCADTASVHVVWHDERHGLPNIEIYYTKSNDSGSTWAENERLTDAIYQSTDPRITTSLGQVHLVWADARDGRADVFYKKSFLYVRGDPNHDKTINAADVVYLINYLFVGGPPPIVFESGDVNEDGQVNAADVVYLINYLFIGGPSPVDC